MAAARRRQLVLFVFGGYHVGSRHSNQSEFAMWRKEPVLIALAGADLVVVAVLTALMSVGVVSIDGSQLAAISAAVVAVTSVVAAVVRAQVMPVDVAAAREIDALFTPVPGVRSNDNLEGL